MPIKALYLSTLYNTAPHTVEDHGKLFVSVLDWMKESDEFDLDEYYDSLGEQQQETKEISLFLE